ncbi:MAG: diacylglycerol kinase, partial [Marivirga sp.]|nr:diacylglycerol kinase [Marivirga sp.]
RPCKITLDDIEYNGNFLLVEIMNIRSIGPNLNIAAEASPDDGELDVILVTESQRRELALYVKNRLTYGKEETFFYAALKAKKVSVLWGGKLLHLDDELVLIDNPARIDIEVIPHVLHFLV